MTSTIGSVFFGEISPLEMQIRTNLVQFLSGEVPQACGDDIDDETMDQPTVVETKNKPSCHKKDSAHVR